MKKMRLAIVLLVCLFLVSAVPFGAVAAEDTLWIPMAETPIAVDGCVSSAEWGNPTKSFTAWTWEDAGDGCVIKWNEGSTEDADFGQRFGTSFDAWFKWDGDFLYFALTSNSIMPGNSMSAAQVLEWYSNPQYKSQGAAMLAVTTYENMMSNPSDVQENVTKGTDLYFSLLDNGEKAVTSKWIKDNFIWNHWDLFMSGDNYAITYADGLLTYEARIPWGMITDQTMAAGSKIATSVAIQWPSKADGIGNQFTWGTLAANVGDFLNFKDGMVVCTLADRVAPPEESVPQESVPQESVPQESVPQESVPQESVPQESVPQESVPQESVPQESVPNDEIAYQFGIFEAGNINIDGTVNASEWGTPTEKFTPYKGWDKDDDEYEIWMNDGVIENCGGAFDAWFKWDEGYLYFAMTSDTVLPGNELSAETLAKWWESSDWWMKGGNWLSVVMYEDWEKNSANSLAGGTNFFFTLLDNGEKVCVTQLEKGQWNAYDAARQVISGDDFAITYAGGKLSYEVRIPWSVITDRNDIKAGDYICTSVIAQCAQTTKDTCGNRLIWGTGASNTNFKEGHIVAKLMTGEENPNTGNSTILSVLCVALLSMSAAVGTVTIAKRKHVF